MMEDTVRDRYLKSKGKENENVMNTKIPGAVLMIILIVAAWTGCACGQEVKGSGSPDNMPGWTPGLPSEDTGATPDRRDMRQDERKPPGMEAPDERSRSRSREIRPEAIPPWQSPTSPAFKEPDLDLSPGPPALSPKSNRLQPVVPGAPEITTPGTPVTPQSPGIITPRPGLEINAPAVPNRQPPGNTYGVERK